MRVHPALSLDIHYQDLAVLACVNNRYQSKRSRLCHIVRHITVFIIFLLASIVAALLSRCTNDDDDGGEEGSEVKSHTYYVALPDAWN